MKKIIITIVVSVILLVAAGVVYLNFFVEREASPEEVRQAYTEKGSVACTFIDPQFGTGELYIKDGQVRGDNQVEAEELAGLEIEESQTHFIIRDELMHFWPIDDGLGMIISTIDDQQEDWLFRNADDPERFISQAELYELNCQKSRVKDELFQLPEEIEFFNPQEQNQPIGTEPIVQELEAKDIERAIREWEEALEE